MCIDLLIWFSQVCFQEKRRQKTPEKGAANPEFKRKSATSFAFKTPTTTFRTKHEQKHAKTKQHQTATHQKKRGNVGQTMSNMLFLILPWSCPMPNDSCLKLN
jgi:hypothetical protein